MNSLITSVHQLDLKNDSRTQNEFAGTVFLEGLDLNSDKIAEEWVSTEIEEDRLDFRKSIEDECYDLAKGETMVDAEILLADMNAEAELNAKKDTEEAAEVMEIDNSTE